MVAPQGFTTRNRKKSVRDEAVGQGPSPRRFTADSVQGILNNLFYAGYVVRQRRSKNGTATSDEFREGQHIAAISSEEFNRVQSVLRAHYKAPRSNSGKLRPYLARGLIRCYACGENAWCHYIKGISYYQESSADRGIHCEAPGRYWPVAIIDTQIERLIRPFELPQSWKERALELANAENNVLDLRLQRRSLEARRRRVVDLYKDGAIDKVEYEREVRILDNQLKSVAPIDATVAELSINDFGHFGEIWNAATPEEKAQLLGRMVSAIYVDFVTGRLLELVPKDGFRFPLEAAEIATPLARPAAYPQLTIGDPDGIRTHDLHRDRVAC